MNRMKQILEGNDIELLYIEYGRSAIIQINAR